MDTRQTRDLPARMEGVQRRFEDWRRTRRAGSRIPDRLWASAAIVAGTYGISRTANVLRINYDTLKKHIKPQTAAAAGMSEDDTAATFFELAHPADHGFAAVPAGSCECTMELEHVGGAKMRIQLRSVAMPDLVAISRSFWNQPS